MSFSSKIKRAEGLITAFIVIWVIVMIYHVVFVRPINLGFLFAFSIVFGFGLYFTKLLRDKLVRDLKNYSFADEDDDQPMTGDEDDPNIAHDEIERKVNNFTETIENVKQSMRAKDLTESGVNFGGEGPPGYKNESHSGQPGVIVDIHYQDAVEFFGEPGCMVDWDDETCFILSQKLAHVQRFMDMSVYKGNDAQRAHYILNEVKSITEELDEFYAQLKLEIVGPDYDDMGDVEGY